LEIQGAAGIERGWAKSSFAAPFRIPSSNYSVQQFVDKAKRIREMDIPILGRLKIRRIGAVRGRNRARRHWGASAAAIAVSIWMAVLPLGPALLAGSTFGQDSLPPSEAQIKAAFLLNFARFAEWDPTAVPETSTLLFFCFDGAENVRLAFQALADGKEIAKRKIINRRITSPADARTCQAVFANDSKRSREAELLKTARDAGALTVGDGPDFLNSGGMIQLLVDDNRMRFDINLASVSRARIKLSSKLLALARHVVELPVEAAN
jgi:hypothetical protein